MNAIALAALMIVLGLVYTKTFNAQELGVKSHVCHLTGNPWLAAGQLERRLDGCSWSANGWAEKEN